MKVQVLPPVGDNYIYLLMQEQVAAVVDPSSARPVLAALDAAGVTLEKVLVTHDHFDHTGGCDELKAETGCEIVGPVSSAGHDVQDGESLAIGDAAIQILFVPGHTGRDVAYYCKKDGLVFTGDTLFVAGCGRLFGGSAGQMWDSLARLRNLPDDTALYCGHDYTIDNLKFAAHLESGNDAVRKKLEDIRVRTSRGEPTVPSTIGEEKATNPFFRCDDPLLQEAMGMAGKPAEKVFAAIRKKKDRW